MRSLNLSPEYRNQLLQEREWEIEPISVRDEGPCKCPAGLEMERQRGSVVSTDLYLLSR